MKSIVFTHMRDLLLADIKIQTGRTNFIPQYEDKEQVYIDFKYEDGTRERLFIAQILDYYPKKIKDFTLIEAKRDGFESIEAFQKGIMEINNIKSKNYWAFIILFKRISKHILEIIKESPIKSNKSIEKWI